jgi:hypothetical protein
MHHTCAFNSSIAASTLAVVTAVTDGILAIQNNNFIFEEPHRLLYAAAMSADLQRARVVTPKARQITTPWIRPIRSAAVPAAEPRIADYRQYAFMLREREEFSVEVFQNNAGAQEVTCIVGLDYGQTSVPNADVYTMRGTSVTAAVADTWTTVAVTWQDSIPVGRYAVCGLEVQSANQRASRLILEGLFPRPGQVGVVAIGDRQHDIFRAGGLGVWGYFNSVRMPVVEVLANAADAAHEIYLSFVRVG